VQALVVGGAEPPVSTLLLAQSAILERTNAEQQTISAYADEILWLLIFTPAATHRIHTLA
jgi:hypothetical protein